MAEQVRAELVARVVQVRLAAGDPVRAGEVLAVLESMKMEIPVVAETSGTVTRVLIAEGDTVRQGDLIAAIS